MTLLSQKLGQSYVSARDQIKIKPIEIEIGEARFTLRVRVPVKKEMEQIVETMSNPSKEATETVYERLSAPLRAAVATGGDDLKEAVQDKIAIMDTDILIEGTSVRQVAMLTAMWEAKVQAYFGLLVSETGEPITESYEEIAGEFPEQVIRVIVEEIESVIKPDYKTAKKN